MTDPARSVTSDTSRPRKRGPRQDVARNRAALIAAAGELLLQDPNTATMPAIAEKAGLHVTTAYRYYSTLEELHREFLYDVTDQLRQYAQHLDLHGEDLFEAVLGRWVELIRDYGPAMVLIRSREGFLARLARGERQAEIMDAAWGNAIRELMHLEGLNPSVYNYALALRNAMFNSREILDLLQITRRSPSRLVHDLTSVYRNALRGLSNTQFL